MKMICGCKIEAIGVRPNVTECEKEHTDRNYACEWVNCPDYRPARMPKNMADWPRCVCGELAQDHN